MSNNCKLIHIEDDEYQNLDELLEKTFTNDIRTGYINFGGVLMPDAYAKIADSIENFQVRDDDIWVCSFPKSGTTWTQEMVWCIANDLNFKGAEISLCHRFPFLELSAIIDEAALMRKHPELRQNNNMRHSVTFVNNLSSPRFIKTHLPFHLLPRDLREGKTDAKIVYVSRNPKDTCISFYHHAQHFAYRGNFEQFCQLFLANKVPYCPFWGHVLDYWSHRRNPKFHILLLRYEEMQADLSAVIQKTSKFLGKSALSPEKLDVLLDHLSFSSMKQNPAVNQQGALQFAKKYIMTTANGEFMREGKVNQWKTAMRPEISQKFDQWTLNNLKSSDLSAEYFSFVNEQ